MHSTTCEAHAVFTEFQEGGGFVAICDDCDWYAWGNSLEDAATKGQAHHDETAGE